MASRNLVFSILKLASRRPTTSRLLDRVLAPFNPLDPRRHIDPYPLYDEARDAGPIFYHRITGMWIVTGYCEVMEVMRGPVSVDRRRSLAATGPYNRMDPDNLELVLSNMLMTDDPEHGRLRRFVGRLFTPRAVADLEPRIEAITAELLADLETPATPSDRGAAGRRRPTGQVGAVATGRALGFDENTGGDLGDGENTGAVDVMAGFAERLPVYVIGELLGIPTERRNELKRLSDVVARFVDPFDDFDPGEMDEAIEQLRSMFDSLATARLAEPGDDLTTALVSAGRDAQGPDRNEVISMLILLLIAGHETTSGLIGNSLVALARNPYARRQLLQRPDLTGNAVEELLRYDSPVQATDRTATRSFTVGGKAVAAGDPLLLLLGAANRDPRRFDGADELRLDRADVRPISFGHGIHHCVGAALARLEATIAIPAFVCAHPRYRLDENRLRWKRSTTLRGPSILPVVLG